MSILSLKRSFNKKKKKARKLPITFLLFLFCANSSPSPSIYTPIFFSFTSLYLLATPRILRPKTTHPQPPSHPRNVRNFKFISRELMQRYLLFFFSKKQTFSAFERRREAKSYSFFLPFLFSLYFLTIVIYFTSTKKRKSKIQKNKRRTIEVRSPLFSWRFSHRGSSLPSRAGRPKNILFPRTRTLTIDKSFFE